MKGMVMTSGGSEGMSSPVADVSFEIRLGESGPLEALDVQAKWLSSSVVATATTGNSGWFQVTPSGAFNTPQQFYEVLAMPTKVELYEDEPTILSSTSSLPGGFNLVQIGVDAHMTIDMEIKEVISTVTSTQILARATWVCHSSGNHSLPLASVCDFYTSYQIRVNVEVTAVTQTTESIQFSDGQFWTTESSLADDFSTYEWVLPWNAAMYETMLVHSFDPLEGQSVFGMTYANMFNDSAMTSATPYLLDPNDRWLSPIRLALYPRGSINIAGKLIIPPTQEELEDRCAPVCEAQDIQPFVISQGTTPVTVVSEQEMDPLAGQIKHSDIVMSAVSTTPTTSVNENNAWFKLTLESGATISFPYKAIQNIGALKKSGMPSSVVETDPTQPIVIHLSSVSLVNPLSHTSSADFGHSPALPATLYLYNVSAVIVSSTPSAMWNTVSIASREPVQLLTSMLPNQFHQPASFSLVSSVNRDLCAATIACGSGIQVSAQLCSGTTSTGLWTYSGAALMISRSGCQTGFALDVNAGDSGENARMQIWNAQGNNENQVWQLDASSQLLNSRTHSVAGSFSVPAQIAPYPNSVIPLLHDYRTGAHDILSMQDSDAPSTLSTAQRSPRSGSGLKFTSAIPEVSFTTQSVSNSFTMSIWMHHSPLTASALLPLVSIGQMQQGQWTAGITSTSVFFKYLPATSAACSATASLSQFKSGPGTYAVNWDSYTDHWHHLALVYDGPSKTASTYFDGVLLGSYLVSGFTTAQKLVIGGGSCKSNDILPSTLQCFGKWAVSLTEAQVLDLYVHQSRPNSCVHVRDYIPQPSVPVNATSTARRCLALVDATVGSNVVQRFCSVNGAVSPSNQWLFGLYGAKLSTISIERRLEHVFESARGYDGSSIGGEVVEYGSDMLFPMIWYDKSTVSVSGTVFISANEHLPGVEQCGMPNIVVKAYAMNDKDFMNPIATSVPTDGSGAWFLALPDQQKVVLVPQLNNNVDDQVRHQFEPASVTREIRGAEHADFVDVTTHSLKVSLLGGVCDIFIGSVSPKVIIPSCQREFALSTTFNNVGTSYNLPATVFEFESLKKADQQGAPQLTSPMSASEKQALAGFLVVDGEFEVDLTSEHQTVDIRYHSSAQVEITSPRWAAEPQCLTDKGYQFSVLAKDAVFTLRMQVWEQYGSERCNKIDVNRTRIWIRDQVSAEPALECYSLGCSIPVSPAGRAEYSTRVGVPFFQTRTDGASYTRDLRYGIAGTSQEEAQKLSILATGSYVFEGKESVKIAPSGTLPIYILRRPPGGSSSASFGGTFSMSSAVSMDIHSGLNSNLGYDTSASGSFSTSTLVAPLGMGIAQPLFGLSGRADVSGFSPTLSPLPGTSAVRKRMVVPDLNSDVFASILETPKAGMYDPSNPNAPFSPSQECSGFAVVHGSASLLLDPDAEAHKIVKQMTNRKLLSGSYDCTENTAKSLSLSESISYTVSASTTSDPALVNGTGDMFLFVVQDITVACTNVLVAFAPPSATNFPVQWLDWNPAEAANLRSDTMCRVMAPEKIPTASTSGDSQVLWVSQATIEEYIIPLTQSILKDLEGSTTSKDKETARMIEAVKKNERNWKDILKYNEDLKEKAVPWPELLQHLTFDKSAEILTGKGHQDLSQPFEIEGDELVVSFAGAMGAISFAVSTSMDQTGSGSKEGSMTGTSSDSMGGQISVAGFGLDRNIHWGYGNARSESISNASSSGNGRQLSFTLADPDHGDFFDVAIRRDPVYGTPVFVTRSGRSRCRYERNTLARENIKAEWSPVTVVDALTHKFTLTLSNNVAMSEPESFSYFFNLDTASNPRGMTVTANGVPMMENSVRITVPTATANSGASAQITVVVKAPSHDDQPAILNFRLTGICYQQVVSSHEYAYFQNKPLRVTI